MCTVYIPSISSFYLANMQKYAFLFTCYFQNSMLFFQYASGYSLSREIHKLNEIVKC